MALPFLPASTTNETLNNNSSLEINASDMATKNE
jgi:hypothetical protein